MMLGIVRFLTKKKIKDLQNVGSKLIPLRHRYFQKVKFFQFLTTMQVYGKKCLTDLE